MGQLRKAEDTLVELGYQVIAVSPDNPPNAAKSIAKHEMSYRLVADPKMVAAKAFGLAYRVDDETYGKLQGYGIDLEAASGETHHLLPVPAVFVIDEGKIEFGYVNPDYRVRLDPDVLIAAAKAARK